MEGGYWLFPTLVIFNGEDFGSASQLLKYFMFHLASFVTRDYGKLSKVGGLCSVIPQVPHDPLFLRHFW